MEWEFVLRRGSCPFGHLINLAGLECRSSPGCPMSSSLRVCEAKRREDRQLQFWRFVLQLHRTSDAARAGFCWRSSRRRCGNGGNDGRGDNNDLTPQYPASYDVENLIAVAAQDRSGSLAGFSNYGPTRVHLAAPGTQIFGADVNRRVIYSESFNSGAPGWTVNSAPGNLSPFPGGLRRFRETDSSPTDWAVLFSTSHLPIPMRSPRC